MSSKRKTGDEAEEQTMLFNNNYYQGHKRCVKHSMDLISQYISLKSYKNLKKNKNIGVIQASGKVTYKASVCFMMFIMQAKVFLY